jgi:hypothetical protein
VRTLKRIGNLAEQLAVHLRFEAGRLRHSAGAAVLPDPTSVSFRFGAYRQFFLLESYIGALFQLGLNQALYYLIPRDVQNAGSYFLNSVLMNVWCSQSPSPSSGSPLTP